MAKVDIFALPIEWGDDTREGTYTDLDGTSLTYTVDRVARQINNVMSGHHALCGMDDCKTTMHQHPFTGEQVAIADCHIMGPLKPGTQAVFEVEEEVRASRPGFDINRQHDGHTE